MPPERTKPAAAPPTVRSRATNDSTQFIEQVDGRGTVPRRFRDIVTALTVDLGGADLVSEAQRQLIRRAASLSVRCELAEVDMAKGKEVDAEDFVRLTNALVRVLSTLGLRRKARDVTRLSDYIEGKAGS